MFWTCLQHLQSSDLEFYFDFRDGPSLFIMHLKRDKFPINLHAFSRCRELWPQQNYCGSTAQVVEDRDLRHLHRGISPPHWAFPVCNCGAGVWERDKEGQVWGRVTGYETLNSHQLLSTLGRTVYQNGNYSVHADHLTIEFVTWTVPWAWICHLIFYAL